MRAVLLCILLLVACGRRLDPDCRAEARRLNEHVNELWKQAVAGPVKSSLLWNIHMEAFFVQQCIEDAAQ